MSLLHLATIFIFQNQWPLKLAFFKYVPFIVSILCFLSLFLCSPSPFSFFCQKQSVDFPTDYPVLPQSQSWVDLWRESREEEEEGRRKIAERKKPNHKGLCFELKSLSPVLTSVSVFPCALCWNKCAAELHAITGNTLSISCFLPAGYTHLSGH